MKIPHIVSWPEHDGFHAAFKLSLSAIYPESFLAPAGERLRPEELWKNAHQRNVRLMSLISRWPLHAFSCELHIVSAPSFDLGVPSRNEIALVFHVRAKDGPTSLKLAMADSIRIDALLSTLWPSAEWSFVRDQLLLENLRPFEPQSCLSIGRRTEAIFPGRPFGVTKSPMGFQTVLGSSSDNATMSPVKHLYPWIPSAGESLSVLLETILSLPSPRWIVVRISSDSNGTTRAHALESLEHAVDVCERFLAGTELGQITQSEQARALRDASLNRFAQLRDGALRGAVLVFFPGQPDYVTANLLGQCITGDHSRRQIANILEGGYAVHSVDLESAMNAFGAFEEDPFSAEEIGGAFRLPILGCERDLGLPVQRHRTVELQQGYGLVSASCIQLASNVYRGVERPIEIEMDSRMHHSLFIGATGVGKSTLLLGNMLQDAEAGRGFALIDPPGDLADEFLARFPKERVQDLIIVDFEDRAYPVPLNVLAWATVEERDLIIDTLYGTLVSVYKSPEFFGPVFEQYFRSGLRLLLGDQPQGDFVPTLLELPKVLRDATFRKYLSSRIKDEEVKDAIEEGSRVSYSEMKFENMAPYVNSKLNRFTQDAQLRRIVGHGKMTLNFRELMDSGKIVIFKLAQGRLGTHAVDIMMAQIVARFRLAAMSRADVPHDQRRPFLLYCDEAHAICDENIADMLSQCRKYSLGLVLATQYARQLEKKGVLQAVLGNIGTLAAFRVSAEDAKLLEPIFSPFVSAQDLIDCPSWSGYMRLHSIRMPSSPFSFRVAPPVGKSADLDWARELGEQSRARWGVSADEIDQQIDCRRRFIRDLATRSE